MAKSSLPAKPGTPTPKPGKPKTSTKTKVKSRLKNIGEGFEKGVKRISQWGWQQWVTAIVVIIIGYFVIKWLYSLLYDWWLEMQIRSITEKKREYFDPRVGGYLPEGWNPVRITKDIYDYTAGVPAWDWWGFTEVMREFNQLNDNQVIAVYNQWIDLYKDKTSYGERFGTLTNTLTKEWFLPEAGKVALDTLKRLDLPFDITGGGSIFDPSDYKYCECPEHAVSTWIPKTADCKSWCKENYGSGIPDPIFRRLKAMSARKFDESSRVLEFDEVELWGRENIYSFDEDTAIKVYHGATLLPGNPLNFDRKGRIWKSAIKGSPTNHYLTGEGAIIKCPDQECVICQMPGEYKTFMRKWAKAREIVEPAGRPKRRK